MRSFIAGAFATWRITSLLKNEDGPYLILAELRDQIGVDVDEFSTCFGRNEVAKAFCCFWCLSVTVGIAVAFSQHQSIIVGIAYSGVAILLESWRNGTSIN